MPSKHLTNLQKAYNKEYAKYEKRIKSAKQAGIEIPEKFIKEKKLNPRTRDIETLKGITRQKITSHKKTQIEKEYDKSYKNYLRRIKSAREAGFLIKEESVRPKIEKPTKTEIQALSNITRESIKRKTLTGEVEYISPQTGEILSYTQAYRESRKRTPKQPVIAYADRPTSFDEAVYIGERINDYFKKYKVPESQKDWLAERFIEQNMRTIRGPEFDYENFKENEEKNGWLFRDPNRQLDPEEINYLQQKYDGGEKQAVGYLIEQLRGWNPEFNYYDKYFENQLNQTGKAPFQIVDDYKQKQYEEPPEPEHKYGERPHEEKREKSSFGQETIEAINLNNLRARLNGVELGTSKYSRWDDVNTAENSKHNLNEFLDRAIEYKGIKDIDYAIGRANAEGSAFQIWFLYHGDVMAMYLSALENYLMDYGLNYEDAENYDTSFETGDDYGE